MLIPQLGYGGAESAFLRVAGFLSRHVEVRIALMARNYGEGAYSTAGTQTKLPMVMLDDERASVASPIAKATRWWRMLRRLRALKNEHDAAISFLSGPNLLNALAGPKAKTIVSERGSKRHDTGMTWLQRLIWTRLLDPLTYSRSSRIIAASWGLAGEITTANPGVADRTIAIEGTVHADRLLNAAEAPIDDVYDQLSEFETIVAVGRLHVQKGFDFLLRVFADVRRVRPAARLLLIGDGPEADRLLALAKELGLRTGGAFDLPHLDVIFAGYQASPHRFIRLGRVFVLTSRFEGLPNALIEALAAGVPILSADCPWGPRSVLSRADARIDDGRIELPCRLPHGTLMPVPDQEGATETWSREIQSALRTPVERLNRATRLRAIAQFDIEATGPEWLRMTREAIGGVA